MHRTILLVLEAHIDLAHARRKRILITRYFSTSTIFNSCLCFAVIKIQTAANAERLAAENEAV